jgi:hypothetical protein
VIDLHVQDAGVDPGNGGGVNQSEHEIIIGLMVLLVLSINLNIFFPLKSEHETGAIKEPAKKYMILVDVEECRLFLLENGQCVKDYLIAPGKDSTPSPTGLFKIAGKDTWGEGFGGRWMGISVPWGTYGIHGTIFPESIGGYASHGCIRMWNEDVKELYDIVPIGTPVMIFNGPYGPFGQGLRILVIGDVGEDVKAAQMTLKEKGFYKYKPDGVFGSELLEELHNFQKIKGLPRKDYIGKAEYKALGICNFE